MLSIMKQNLEVPHQAQETKAPLLVEGSAQEYVVNSEPLPT